MILTTMDLKRIRELRYEDGLSAPATARMVGCGVVSVLKYAPGRPGKVPNAKLRAAFEASGLSAAEVARRIGWMCTSGADGSRVKRTLGLLQTVNGEGVVNRRVMIDAETAALMAEAIGIMPWEVLPDEEAA